MRRKLTVGASAAVTWLFRVHEGTDVHGGWRGRRWLRQHAAAYAASGSRPYATASAVRGGSPRLRPPPRHRARRQRADDNVAIGHVHHRTGASATGACSLDSSPPFLPHIGQRRAQESERDDARARARENGELPRMRRCGGIGCCGGFARGPCRYTSSRAYVEPLRGLLTRGRAVGGRTLSSSRSYLHWEDWASTRIEPRTSQARAGNAARGRRWCRRPSRHDRALRARPPPPRHATVAVAAVAAQRPSLRVGTAWGGAGVATQTR